MPVVEGLKPSMRLVREGLHSGACVWAFVKVVPRDAKRLICGVCTCGWPPSGSTQSLRSSMAMKRILGLMTLVPASEHAAKATGMSAARRKRVRVSRRRRCTDAKVARPTSVAEADLRTQRAYVAVCAGRSIVPVAAKDSASCRGPFQPGKLPRITETL